MIYKIDSLLDCRANMGGKWVIARPENYKYRTLKERICDAWAVFAGKADAVRFMEEGSD